MAEKQKRYHRVVDIARQAQYSVPFTAEEEAAADAMDAPPNMAAIRQAALEAAMAFGNAITQREMGQWAGVEPFSWGQQREEAIRVRRGEPLDETALLPLLALGKGVSLEEYAESVYQNALRYQNVLSVAAIIRREATTTLLDPMLDTPEKVQDAVGALRQRVLATAKAVGIDA